MRETWIPSDCISGRKYGIENLDMTPYKMPSGGYNINGSVTEHFNKPIIPDYIFLKNIKDWDNSFDGVGLTDIIGPLKPNKNGELSNDYSTLTGNWFRTGLQGDKEKVDGYFPTNPNRNDPYSAFECNRSGASLLKMLFECERTFSHNKWVFYDKKQNKIEIPLLNCVVDGEKVFNSTLLLNVDGNGHDIQQKRNVQTVIGLLLTEDDVKLLIKEENNIIPEGKYIGNVIYYIKFYSYLVR